MLGGSVGPKMPTGNNPFMNSKSPSMPTPPMPGMGFPSQSNSKGGLDVDDLVKRIDAKIAELEEEERREKEAAAKKKEAAMTSNVVDANFSIATPIPQESNSSTSLDINQFVENKIEPVKNSIVSQNIVEKVEDNSNISVNPQQKIEIAEKAEDKTVEKNKNIVSNIPLSAIIGDKPAETPIAPTVKKTIDTKLAVEEPKKDAFHQTKVPMGFVTDDQFFDDFFNDEHEDIHKLYDRNRIRNNYLKIDNHTSREKISILFDGMWKAMIYNTNRLKYSCKLLSYYLNIPYEELLKSLSLGKNELDKRNINNKG